MDVASLPATIRSRVVQASASIYTMCFLYTLGFSPADGLDLWPRIWPWLQFMDTYHGSIRTVKLGEADLLLTIGCFRRHGPNDSLMKSTIGIWEMVMRAWVIIYDVQDQHMRKQAFIELGTFLRQNLQTEDFPHLEEAVAGAAGSIDLASLVVKHLKYIRANLHILEPVTFAFDVGSVFNNTT
ncbi:hypothetical protein C8J57DRAFT_220470 [Mycena rebaudengoi]|nr:hypothetical protein C8J57DRAFT_220470 [Mycena rebaudengoi]